MRLLPILIGLVTILATPAIGARASGEIGYLAYAEDGFWQVWVMDSDGENARQVSRSPYDKGKLSWFPDGRHLLLVARQVRKGTPSTVEPEARYAVMLACDAHHGHRIVHADGLGPDNAVPVGWECRSCPREACEQRAFPMLSVTAPRPSPPARSSHPDGLLDAAPRM